jgi:8-oxo-dGTP pyrophosphatase MutT (NUDIX family)
MRKRAVAVIIKKNEILLIHRFNYGKEYFVLPGGGIKKNETPKNAAKREVMEETGLEIKIEKLLFKIENRSQPEFYHLAEYISGKIKPSFDEGKKSKNNQRFPVWKKLNEFYLLSNFYPQKAQKKIMKKRFYAIQF